MAAIAAFRREWGTSVRAWRARTALRMRVSMSEIGSFILSHPRAGPSRPGRLSPARLRHPGDEPLERQVAETDAAHLEPAHVGTRPPAPLAAVAVADRELGGPPDRRLPRLRRHRRCPSSFPLRQAAPSRRNGSPSAARRLRASSSVFAVVTIVTFMPRAL